MFTPLQHGTNHMLGQDNWTPLTTQNYEVRIYNIDGSSPTENANLLTLSTNDIGDVVEKQNVITVHYGNGIIKFPGKVDIQDVSWTLNCYCEPNVLEPLRAWRKQCYDAKEETIGIQSQYRRQVFFIRYDGQWNVRDAIRCPGTWISDLDNGNYNAQGDALVQVKVNFVISKAIYLTAAELQ